jgi:hypothetical protein
MARVQNPILFSAYFGVQPKTIAAAGLIDPFLDVDVPLFIDPILLAKSSNPVIAKSAVERFRRHFEVLVRMLAISQAENDAAWKGARRQLDLSEPPENGLGYAAADGPAVLGLRTSVKRSCARARRSSRLERPILR